MTVGCPPSIAAITELVVPRSIPTALAMAAPPTARGGSIGPSSSYAGLSRAHRQVRVDDEPFTNLANTRHGNRRMQRLPPGERMGLMRRVWLARSAGFFCFHDFRWILQLPGVAH